MRPECADRGCQPEEKRYAIRGASLMQKWKQTAIFTLRFKMLTARTPELSAPKFLLAQNGVRFGKLCSAGRSRSSHSRSRACMTLQLRSPSSLLRAKHSTTSHTRQQIIQTDDIRRKNKNASLTKPSRNCATFLA